ncbi:MAG: CRISPR-associated helicase Cas3' [Anaerolineaceae bacterium]|nr:CRISPR-associated helicase Cas3' [Anaerolineaceae bacterium]
MAKFIARFNEATGKTQTIIAHLKKVAAYCRLFGDPIGLGATCELLGWLHDIGKYNILFQIYIKEVMRQPNKPHAKVDHAVYGALYAYQFADREAIKTSSIVWFFLRDILSMVLAYHHGGLQDFEDMEGQFPLAERLQNCDPKNYQEALDFFFKDIEKEEFFSKEQLDQLFYDSYKEITSIFNILLGEERKHLAGKDKSFLPFYTSLLIKLLSSCLIDADRGEAAGFKGVKLNIQSHLPDHAKKYQSALKKKLGAIALKPSASKTEQEVHKARQIIHQECSFFGANHEAGIYTLSAPTGSGKTFASIACALEYAISQASKRKVHRIIYVAPFTTILDQNAEEVRNGLGCQGQLLEHHSNVNINEQYDDESAPETAYKLHTERWDCELIFTTSVQFLNTFYAYGTQGMRKLHQMANSVIIFDEAHTIPVKCMYLFTLAMNFLSTAMQSMVLLCTATQLPFNRLNCPIWLSPNGELLKDPEKMRAVFKRMELSFDAALPEISQAAFLALLEKEYKESASVLLVLNTKRCVNEVASLLREETGWLKEGDLFQLTTNLCPAHRKQKIAELKSALEQGRHILCISTNLIECGVDISFDRAIRNLAGLPAILQTMGRAHRNGEKGIGKTVIINFKEPIARLQEVSEGLLSTKTLLLQHRNDPKDFFLSGKALQEYYNYFLNSSLIPKSFRYPIRINGYSPKTEDAVTLLSRSKPREGNKPSLRMPLRFCAKAFKVIEDNTVTVLVPYEKGADFVAQIQNKQSSGAYSYQSANFVTREMQNYCISIFNSNIEALCQAGIVTRVEGYQNFYYLTASYYQKDCGFSEVPEISPETILY